MGLRESLGLPEVELTPNQQTLVQKLKESDKAGIRLIQRIIEGIQLGCADDIKTLCWNESDKFRQMPEVIDLLKTYLFEGSTDNPWPSSSKK